MAGRPKLTKGKTFEFKSAKKGGGETKYPWDAWFSSDEGATGVLLPETKQEKAAYASLDEDGKKRWREQNHLVFLERSEGPENEKGTIETPTVAKDFGVSVNAMIPKLHTAARRRYKVLQISRNDADGVKLKNALIINARDMTPEERVEEDELRAEEKADREAAKKEAKKADVLGPSTIVTGFGPTHDVIKD